MKIYIFIYFVFFCLKVVFEDYEGSEFEYSSQLDLSHKTINKKNVQNNDTPTVVSNQGIPSKSFFKEAQSKYVITVLFKNYKNLK